MPYSAYEHVSVDADDGVVRITLDRPEKYNALNDATFLDLQRVFGEITLDPDNPELARVDQTFGLDEARQHRRQVGQRLLVLLLVVLARAEPPEALRLHPGGQS